MSAPNFLIIGERRSGTTTLARWIEAHPEIYLHPRMDKAFFWDNEVVGAMDWKEGSVDLNLWEKEHNISDYEAMFPDSNEYKAIGEKSADYLFWDACHERIKSFYPDIKLVITLRNPIERAWSMYWNEFGKGRESLSFEEAIKEEDNRIAISDYAKAHLSYLSRGNYANSIRNLLKVFDQKNIHVVILENSIKDPQKTLKDLYSFLNVDTNKGFDNVGKKFNRNWTLVQRKYIASNGLFSFFEKTLFRLINIGGKVLYRKNIYARRRFISFIARPFRKGKEDHKMLKSTREKLVNHFKPMNQELEVLINKDLNWF